MSCVPECTGQALQLLDSCCALSGAGGLCQANPMFLTAGEYLVQCTMLTQKTGITLGPLASRNFTITLASPPPPPLYGLTRISNLGPDPVRLQLLSSAPEAARHVEQAEQAAAGV
jgi:hypothetical protein